MWRRRRAGLRQMQDKKGEQAGADSIRKLGEEKEGSVVSGLRGKPRTGKRVRQLGKATHGGLKEQDSHQLVCIDFSESLLMCP